MDAMPHWWPKNIRFRDPNNGKPKMKLWEFNLIIKAYQEKLPMGGLCVPEKWGSEAGSFVLLMYMCVYMYITE